MKRKMINIIMVLVLAFSVSSTPVATVEAADGGFVAVSAGTWHSLAIKSDGSLWAWGGNKDFQCHGTYDDKLTPLKVMDDVSEVSAGYTHSFAVKSDGSLWAWGYGRLGDGNQYGNKLRQIKIMDGVSAVSTGAAHTLAIKSDGSLWAWGWNAFGQLGDGTMTTESQLTPVKIMDDFSAISVGLTHSLAKKSDGSLWAWGRNAQGQLGDGTTEDQLTPIKIMDNVSAVCAGRQQSLAVKSDGSLWVWGNYKYGQLEGGTIPVKVMDDVLSASVGGNHTLAIKKDGSLWAWGNNERGQLGNGTTENSSTPIKIMTNVTAVSAGSSHSLAIKSDGSLWSWGYNESGQLGDGTRENRLTPVRMADDATIHNPDIPSQWAEPKITAAIKANLVPPQLQSNYTKPATRAKFATLAVTLYENVIGEITGRSTFTDTNDVNVQKAAAIGVVTGVGGGRFDPNAQLTLEQAATMLARLAEAMDKPLPKQAPTFYDKAEISSWAVEQVGQVQAAGIMSGYWDNIFGPKDTYTWEESIVTILRLYDLVK